MGIRSTRTAVRFREDFRSNAGASREDCAEGFAGTFRGVRGGGVADFREGCRTSEGVRVIKNTNARSVRKNGDGTIALQLFDRESSCQTETPVVADALLIAVGRTPNFRKLRLKAARVEFGESGVHVNEFLQTSQPHIYAVGDVVGPFQFTHMADAQARVVVRNILMPFQFLRQKMNYSVVPWCTYTDPEVAHVG